MEKTELAEIIEVLLRNELIAKAVEREGDVVVVTFLSGDRRTIVVS